MVALSAARSVLASFALLAAFSQAATAATTSTSASASSSDSQSAPSQAVSSSSNRIASAVLGNAAAAIARTSASASSAANSAATKSTQNSAATKQETDTTTKTTAAPKSTLSTTDETSQVKSSASSFVVVSSTASASTVEPSGSSSADSATATATATIATETNSSTITQSSATLSTFTTTSAPTSTSTSTSSFVDASCSKVPRSFSGTAAGLKGVCSVRYCYPSKAAAMSWSGLTGEVTREEIETALGVIAHVDPLTANGQGNVLSDGSLGQTAYSAALLFELSGDIRALDWTVALADNILWLQQLELSDAGQVMWTGSREAVWPTYDLPPHNTTVLQYAGSENGDAAGHMLAPALYILKNPCLYDLVPSPPTSWTGPTPFNATSTYLERALAYISAGDATVDYFLKYFLDSDNKLIQPDDKRWNLVGDTGNKPGDPMPWNRRFLTLHAFHKLATAHRHSEALDASRAELLDNIIQINVADFMSDLNSTTTLGGDPAYVWEYTAESETNTEEVEGVHAYFDIWGMFMAWQRFPTIVSDADMTIFGNTMQQVSNLGDGTFSGLVNGKSSKKAPSVSTLWGGWSVYSLFVDGWWGTIAGANFNHGWGSSIPASVPLLWTKQARYLDSSAFWQGLYSTDADSVSFSSADESGDGAQASAIAAAAIPTGAASAAVGAVTSVGGDVLGGLVSVVSAQVSTVLYGTSESLSTNLVTVTEQAKVQGVSTAAAVRTTKVVTTVSGKVKTITKTIKSKTSRKASHAKSALHGAYSGSKKPAAAAASGRKSTGTSSGSKATQTGVSSSSGPALVVGKRWESVGGFISSGVALAVGAGLFLLN